ncbi:hypothetical protein G1H11_08375 [Phytoactinopolyspora alkaliphila]|uniref:Oxidoreductase n=1 Tax=Phytoactinopolyspora alkaliphila TaxID=1783498 RepID=A0A6N9YK94_9ACTN|nr:hypothetical protein [Phytoactinopolyspora alkaliphila]NED95330.1 hypothetical protein [Phytoactinopolyspora alkaliphila]
MRLTPAEKALRDALEQGGEAVLGRDIDPRAIASADEFPESRVVRADVLAELVRDGSAAYGAAVRLTGARVTGDMLFRYGRLGRPIRLDLCWVDETVGFAELFMAGIELTRCHLPGLRTESVDVEGSFTVRDCHLGPTMLADTRVHRSMSFEDSRFITAETPFRAHNFNVWGNLLFDRARMFAGGEDALHTERFAVGGRLGLAGLRARGSVVFSGASKVDGRVDMTNAVIRNGDGTAVDARRLTAAGLYGDGMRCTGTLDLRHATITGTVAFNGAVLACPKGYALHAGDVAADRIELESGARVQGAVSLPRSVIRDTLAMRGLSVRETAGRAVVASGARITNLVADNASFDGHVALDEIEATYVRLVDTRVSCPHDAWSVSLQSATVRRELNCEGLYNEGTLNAYAAKVGTGLVLSGARLNRPDGRALNASRAVIGGRMTFGEAFQADGDIDLSHADIGKSLAMDGARVAGKVRLFRCRVRSDVLLRNATVEGAGIVIDGIGLRVDGRFTARNLVARGGLRLTAISTDSLVLTGARLINPDANALIASRAEVRGDLVAGNDPYSSNAGSFWAEGRVILRDATVGGDVILDGSVLRAPGHHALDCTGINVGGKVSLHGTEVDGTAGLNQARVRRRIVSNGAKFTGNGVESADGPVVLSALRTISGDLVIEGGSFRGAVRLTGATFDSGVRINGASITAGSGVALVAAELTCGVLRLSELDVQGAVVLARSRVSGDLICEAMSVTSESRPVVTTREAEIARRLSLDGLVVRRPRVMSGSMDLDLSAIRAGSVDLPQGECSVDLRDAAVRTLVLDPTDTTTVLLSGLTFDDPGGASVETALAWLRRDPTGYQHQAYEQLAAHYRRIGDDAAARTVLLARHRHRRDLLGRSSFGHLLMKAWGYIQDAMVGYGYRPGLAALWFAGLLAFGTVYFAGKTLDPIDVNRQPTFTSFGYSLDLLVPVLRLEQAASFDPRGLDLWVAYGLIFMGAVLVTTIGAAVTRILGRR